MTTMADASGHPITGVEDTTPAGVTTGPAANELTAPTERHPQAVADRQSTPGDPSWDTVMELGNEILSFQVTEGQMFSDSQIEVFRQFLTQLNLLGLDAANQPLVREIPPPS